MEYTTNNFTSASVPSISEMYSLLDDIRIRFPLPPPPDPDHCKNCEASIGDERMSLYVGDSPLAATLFGYFCPACMRAIKRRLSEPGAMSELAIAPSIGFDSPRRARQIVDLTVRGRPTTSVDLKWEKILGR